MNYSKSAISGISWMFSSSLGLQTASLVVNIILARLLLPADFGIVAIAISVSEILKTFGETGVSVALVQRKDIDSTEIDTAFTLTVVFGSAIAGVLWFTSGWASNLFGAPDLSGLLKILGIAFLLRITSSVYRSIMLRDLRYSTIAQISMISYVVYGIVAIILALNNFGAYSIAWANIGSTATMLVVGFLFTRYTPYPRFVLYELKQLLQFGVWITLARILKKLGGKVDNLIIGKAVDMDWLGGYHLAQRLVMIIPSTYTNIIDQVMLPIYSKWQDEPIKIEDGYWKILSFSSVFLVPVIFILMILAETVVRIVYGETWLFIVPIARVVCLFGLMRVLGDGIFDSVVFACGRPQVLTIVNLFRVSVLPLCLIVGCRWGIMGAAWSLVIYGVIARLFNQCLLKYYFDYPLRRYFRAIAPAALFSVLAWIISHALLQCFTKLGFAPDEESASWIVALFWTFSYAACVSVFARDKLAFVSREFFHPFGRLLNRKLQRDRI